MSGFKGIILGSWPTCAREELNAKAVARENTFLDGDSLDQALLSVRREMADPNTPADRLAALVREEEEIDSRRSLGIRLRVSEDYWRREFQESGILPR